MKYDTNGQPKGKKTASKKANGKYISPDANDRPGFSHVNALDIQEAGESRELHKTNHYRLLKNEISWRHLSNIEVARGMGFGIHGDFRAVLTRFGPLPDRLQQALVQETIRRAHIKAMELAFRGLNVIEDIMDDEDQKASDRLRAVDMVMSRAWGAPTQLVIQTDTKFDSILESVAGVDSSELEDPDLQRVNAALTMGSVDDEVWDVEFEDVED